MKATRPLRSLGSEFCADIRSPKASPALTGGLTAPTVSADEACETMLLTPAARRQPEELEGRLALELYRYLPPGRFEAEPESSRQDDAAKSGADSQSGSSP